MIFKSFLFHAFQALDLGFLFLFFLAIFLGFWVFFRCEYYGLGYVNLILYDHALHPQCIITMFHAYLDVCDWLLLLNAVRFGLGDPHDALKFLCHMFMHLSCIRSFLIYSKHVFPSIFFLSLYLLDRLRHGTQIAQIYFSLKPSSWF